MRYWLYDLATEISAAEKDGTLPPELALDRVWITGDGRAKLLDFPAPGLGKSDTVEIRSPNRAVAANANSVQASSAEVAAAALEGRADASAKAAGEVAVPLPLHARDFLKSLPQIAGADAVAARSSRCCRGGGGFAIAPGRPRCGLHRLSVAGVPCRILRLDAAATIVPEQPGPDGTEQPAATADLDALLGRQANQLPDRPPIRHLHRQPLPGGHHQ